MAVELRAMSIFLPKERTTSRPISEQTLFALGSIIYFVMTGREVFPDIIYAETNWDENVQARPEDPHNSAKEVLRDIRIIEQILAFRLSTFVRKSRRAIAPALMSLVDSISEPEAVDEEYEYQYDETETEVGQEQDDDDDDTNNDQANDAIDDEGKPIVNGSALPGFSSTNWRTNIARRRQADFLDRLMQTKRRRGETDIVPTVGDRKGKEGKATYQLDGQAWAGLTDEQRVKLSNLSGRVVKGDARAVAALREMSN
ncbi:hypothetical protein DV738_g4467, partial [Chaetothyriales sp. CBS 135597]